MPPSHPAIGTGTELFEFARFQVTGSSRVVISSRFWDLDLRSPFWRLYVNKQPGGTIFHEGKRWDLLPDRIYLIPAWVRFQTTVVGEVEHDYLHFLLTGFPVEPLRTLFNRPMALRPNPGLAFLCRKWRERLSLPHDFQTFVWADALANAVMGQVISERTEAEQRACFHGANDAATIRPALEMLHHRLANPPENAELARACHASTGYFVRRFRQIVGLTPARYGLELRVGTAAQWLAHTPRTMEEIAAATGFTDRFHFSRIFKAQFGVPPGQYRRMHRSDQAPSAPRHGGG